MLGCSLSSAATAGLENQGCLHRNRYQERAVRKGVHDV